MAEEETKRSAIGSGSALSERSASVECADGGAPDTKKVVVDVLIPTTSSHPGAGAVVIKNAVSESLLERIDTLRRGLPLDKRRPTAHRRFFRDEAGWVRQELLRCLRSAGVVEACDDLMPWFRFIEYSQGGGMAPHTDGSNAHPDTGHRSTTTILLYLSTCPSAGGTALLESMAPGSPEVACVYPERGTVLMFPHRCPHVGKEVAVHPKIALRAELIRPPAAVATAGAS